MYKTQPVMTGGCQCGAVRYALFETPESTICHCRMCQKAVGGPFAALSKVPLSRFAWTRGEPAAFRSSIGRRAAFLRRLRHPADVPFPGRRRDRGHHRQPRHPRRWRPPQEFRRRVPAALDRPDCCPGALPEVTAEANARDVVSRQHPDHEHILAAAAITFRYAAPRHPRI